MENIAEKVGYCKDEILNTLHEVIVESALSECGDVSKNHVIVLDALYQFVKREF